MPKLINFAEEALLSLETFGSRAAGLIDPSFRLGVTGLSRAGKTVFITALIQNLLNHGNLPLFSAMQGGRIKGAKLAHQPDDTVPRFQFEEHIQKLVEDRVWPESTRAVSEFRITIAYESASAFNRTVGPGKLSLDIIDYPGEWLLDLPLLGKDYATFSKESLEAAASGARSEHAADWIAKVTKADPEAPFQEPKAEAISTAFTAYLRACKDDPRALSSLPPGRFLMPGDLAGSPALTFAPLPNLEDHNFKKGSLAATFERRYEAYKAQVIKPFFKDHVARIDRQIVLIDAMQAINAGPDSLADLEGAITDILACFRPGGSGLLSSLFLRRLDRILIAATKADQLHHESHDRLAALIRRLADNAIKRGQLGGAEVQVMALAAMRATREGTVKHEGEDLPVIVGTPQKGENINGEIFDGKTETAIFPGDLPVKPESLFEPLKPSESYEDRIRFVRFRPPQLTVKHSDDGTLLVTLPHIRLDRAFEFLMGDKLA